MKNRTLLAVLVLATGCQHDPHAGLYATSEPAVIELVGTYAVDGGRIGRWKPAEVVGLHCSVELRADGTFTATNVPRDNSAPHADLADRLGSGTGTWRVEIVGGNESRKIWGVHFAASPSRFATPFVTGDGGTHGLIFVLGDPDSGEAIEMSRRDV